MKSTRFMEIKLYFLKLVCLFGAASLCADGELAQAELQARLARTDQRADTRFHMYKELLALQLHSYRVNGGDVEALASAVRIATTATEVDRQQQQYIDALNVEEKEIFASYSALISLASELSVDAVTSHLTFNLLVKYDVKAVLVEPLQLYFLQILELEEDLHFPVHGALFWVREQAIALTGILKQLEQETAAMIVSRAIHNQADLTLKHKELKFYWTTIVDLYHDFLFRLDSRWSECEYDRMKILNLVLGNRFSFSFPDPGNVPDCIDRFLPFILKHADLELAKTRFLQKNHQLNAWDFNFEWIALHVKAAKLLLPSDPEKAKAYLEKAKKLTEDTLWCYSFSPNRAHWNAKQEEARQLIERSIEQTENSHALREGFEES